MAERRLLNIRYIVRSLLVVAFGVAVVATVQAETTTGSDPDLKFVTVNGQRVLPAENAERMLQRLMVAKLAAKAPGVKIGPARCPAIVANGRKQTCSLPIADAVARIRVVAFELDPGHPLVWYSTDQDVLDMRKIESIAVSQGSGKIKSVRCPPEHYHAYEIDEVFTCAAQLSDGTSARVLVRATDDLGGAEIQLVP